MALPASHLRARLHRTSGVIHADMMKGTTSATSERILVAQLASALQYIDNLHDTEPLESKNSSMASADSCLALVPRTVQYNCFRMCTWLLWCGGQCTCCDCRAASVAPASVTETYAGEPHAHLCNTRAHCHAGNLCCRARALDARPISWSVRGCDSSRRVVLACAQTRWGSAEPPTIRQQRRSRAPRRCTRVHSANAIAGRAYTLSEWLHVLRLRPSRTGITTETALQLAVALQRIPRPEVRRSVGKVLQGMLRLVRCVPAVRGEEARVLDAVAQAFAVHPVLLRVADADAEASQLLDWALDVVAAADATYTSRLCTARMATAQLKLRRYSAAFWERLEQSGLQHLRPCETAIVVYRAAALTEMLQAPPPPAPLWAAMEGAIAEHVLCMRAQGVAKVLWALAKLGSADESFCFEGKLRFSVLTATLHTSPDMNAQAVTNTLWALLELDGYVDDWVLSALLAAAQRTSSEMGASSVANMLAAVAQLQLRPDPVLRAALCTAAQRTSAEMNAQNVANTLMALAKPQRSLRLQPDDRLRSALCGAALRESGRMSAQELSNTLWALASLRIKPPEQVANALFEGIEREQQNMTGQATANVLWAASRISSRVPSCARDSLLAAALRTSARGMDMRAISSTLSALAKLRWQLSIELQVALGRGIQRSCANMNAQGVAVTLDAVGRLRLPLQTGSEEALRAALSRHQMTGKRANMCRIALSRLRWRLDSDTQALIETKAAQGSTRRSSKGFAARGGRHGQAR